MRKVSRLARAFMFCLAALALPAVASGAPADDSASHKSAGDALFDQGRYAEAYDAYKRAYAARPDPALLYNEARALEAMGEYPEALDKLEKFALDAPEDVRAKVPKLAELIADLRARTCTIHVTTNAPGARLYLRGKDMGPLAREQTVRARAGEASLRVVAEGYEPWSLTMELAGGSRVDVDAQMKPVRSEPTASGGGVASKWWFWTALGVLVAGGATTTAVLLTTDKDPQRGEGFVPDQIRVKSF